MFAQISIARCFL